MSRSPSRLEALLFEDDGRSVAELAHDPRRLVGRLLLAEVLDAPPALRRPGHRSPLGPPLAFDDDES